MNKDDENILVVKSDIIFKDGSWQGIKRDNLDYYINLIKNNYSFKRRGDVENDPSYQQIIPYIIFSHNNNFFIYKYLEKAGEKRLVNHFQLGIGGHIEKADENIDGDILRLSMMREWNEEVDYRGNLVKENLIGILNDDSTPVNAVHLGLVYHFEGDSPKISIKEKEVLSGELRDITAIKNAVENSNDWANIIYKDYISQLS